MASKEIWKENWIKKYGQNVSSTVRGRWRYSTDKAEVGQTVASAAIATLVHMPAPLSSVTKHH